MKSAVGGLLLALLLFAGAWACLTEAGFTRRLAGAQEQLATLQYNAAGENSALALRQPLPIASLAADVRRYQAVLSYWRADYRGLTAAAPLAGGNARDEAADPAVLLIAANAAFREAMGNTANQAATASHLEQVAQAYANVLRAEPGNTDAAYNYEYVMRLRDTLAKGKTAPGYPPQGQPRLAGAKPDVSIDLPTGPTVHGRPGGPPQDQQMKKFNTVIPMRSDERKEIKPGLGPETKRRG